MQRRGTRRQQAEEKKVPNFRHLGCDCSEGKGEGGVLGNGGNYRNGVAELSVVCNGVAELSAVGNGM